MNHVFFGMNFELDLNSSSFHLKTQYLQSTIKNWYSEVCQSPSILGLVSYNLGLPGSFLTFSSFALEIFSAVSGVISSIAASQLIG